MGAVKVASGKLQISYVLTDKMLAEIFTKPLGRVKHEAAVRELGLC